MVKQPKATNGAQPSDAAPKYDIDYGRPPREHKFKPGHPGCGGRPKRQRNLRTVLEETLTADDQAIFADLLRRLENREESKQPADSTENSDTEGAKSPGKESKE